MNILAKIVNTNERIPRKYREETNIEEIKDDIISIFKNFDITNEHLYNLKSLILPEEKSIIKIEDYGKQHTMDLEINDDSHSYIANGIPVHNTINISNKYPFTKFSEMFMELWESGARGITTYREGSRTAVLETGKATTKVIEEQEEFYDIWNSHKNGVVEENVKLPTEYPMTGHIIKSEGKKWYVNVAFKDRAMNKPFAIFVQTNHTESETNTSNAVDLLTELAYKQKIPEEHILENEDKLRSKNNVNKIARMVGLLLRHNVKIDKIVDVLDKVDVSIVSFVFTLKKFLTRYVKNGTISTVTCKACNGTVIFEQGCLVCRDCSYSVC